MKKELINLALFLFICFIVYLLFRSLSVNTLSNYGIEGMTNSDDSSSASNGVAGNAAAYAASLKAATIKKQDTFLISKYRNEYEDAILNLDDYINNFMLQTALNVDPNDPESAVKKLAEMNQAKAALNSVMKFVEQSN
jgi:hypothetical protein